MQQKFLPNLILLVLLNLVVKPVAIFGIDATVQNRVGAEDYGMYFSLLSFTYLFNILLDLGINNFTTKNVAQHPNLMAKYIGKIAGLRLVLFLVYAVFTIALSFLLGYPLEVYSILGILIVQQFLISMIAYFRSFLSGLLLFRLDAFMSVLDRFLLIILCGTMLFLTRQDGSFQIEQFVFIQFWCYFISFVVGAIFVIKYAGKMKIRVEKPISILIVRQSIPYALLIILMALFTRIDSVMLERMLEDGAKQAGYYVQGFRLIEALFMIAMLFSNLLLPLFSRMIQFKEDAKELFSMSSKLLVWGAIAIAAFCFWNAFDILDLIYVNDVSQSAPPFQLLVLTFVAMCIILIFGTYLTALGEMKTLNRIAFIGLIISVVSNLFLIPKYGVYGAAISTLATQFFVAATQVLVVVNRLKLNWTLLGGLVFLLYVGVVFVGIFFAKHYNVHLLIQLMYLLFCLLVFKVIDFRSIVSLKLDYFKDR